VAGSETRNRVALLYDWNVRWALDDASLLHKNNMGYQETVQQFYNVLISLGYGVDMVDETCDLSAYRVLVAPMAYMIRNGFGQRVQQFVKDGGVLVSSYVSGYVDEEMLTYLDADPCPLNEVTGLHLDEFDALDDITFAHFDWNGKTYQAHSLAELNTAFAAEPLAAYSDRFYAGMPCFTRNAYGAGKAYHIAVRTGDDFLTDALGWILKEAQLKPLCESCTYGVSITQRWKDGKRFVFAANPLHKAGEAVFEKPMRDMRTGEVLGTVCTIPELSIRVLVDAE